VIVNALKAGQPTTASKTASVAAAPEAAAQTFTISIPGTETDGAAPAVTPVSTGAESAETPAQAPAETPAEAPAEVPAEEAVTETPVEEAPVEEVEIEEPEAAEPVTRPSLKQAGSGKTSPKRAGNPRAAA
jgi:hypothetical protein